MLKFTFKNNITTNLQKSLKDNKWMFFVFILWAITYIALSEGVLIQQKTITVTGNSMNTNKNEVATFNITISSSDPDKMTAVEDTNRRSGIIIDALRSFGIPEDDLKTANMSIYQQQEYVNGRSVDGDWYASASVEITLKDADKANELTDLLANLDIDNFYGPNFSIDSYSLDETVLLNDALADAQSKALTIARTANKKLGSMVSFVESGAVVGRPVYSMFDKAVGFGGGGAEVLPGTSDSYKSVTVTYIIK